MSNSTETCKAYLKAYRKEVGAKPDEKIDKRYGIWLAPNDKTYDSAHCGFCAEVEYLSDIYTEENQDEKLHTLPCTDGFP